MSISASMVKELRERTGAGMMECKKALVEAGGDLDAAAEILRLLPETMPALQAKATFDSRLVLGTALFIFLLVQIWGYGLELERDRALTI